MGRLLAERLERSVLVEGDAFYAFLAAGVIEPWLPEAHEQNTLVTKVAASAAGAFASGGLSTIYEGVVGPWFLPTFAEACGLEHLDYAVLLPPVEVCLERVLTRPDHGFRDDAATRAMHADFAEAPVDERHVLRDVLPSPEDVATAITSAQAAGTLRYEAA